MYVVIKLVLHGIVPHGGSSLNVATQAAIAALETELHEPHVSLPGQKGPTAIDCHVFMHCGFQQQLEVNSVPSIVKIGIATDMMSLVLSKMKLKLRHFLKAWQAILMHCKELEHQASHWYNLCTGNLNHSYNPKV